MVGGENGALLANGTGEGKFRFGTIEGGRTLGVNTLAESAGVLWLTEGAAMMVGAGSGLGKLVDGKLGKVGALKVEEKGGGMGLGSKVEYAEGMGKLKDAGGAGGCAKLEVVVGVKEGGGGEKGTGAEKLTGAEKVGGAGRDGAEIAAEENEKAAGGGVYTGAGTGKLKAGGAGEL